MPDPLRLELTDYQDATRWRWVLSDARGCFLADHDVRLDPASREYAGFLDLAGYLDYHQRIYPPERQLAELGAWIGEQVFGGLRDALWERRALPAVAVQVTIPPEPPAAQELLLCPFELACFADGTRFWEAGIRFVYQLAGTPPGSAKEPAARALRVLAVFSLPAGTDPLDLRRERYGLQRLARELGQTRGLAVELRALQYGATRETLRAALEEGEGWDIVHLSGHGLRGELLLEDERGGSDTVDADELGALLDPARARLKLLILDACYSGQGSHAAARAQVGLDTPPARADGTAARSGRFSAAPSTPPDDEARSGQFTASPPTPPEPAPTVLPGLAQTLAARLDCAAVAMRYPVGDAFATELMLSLYGKLLDKRQPLPAALHLALGEALAAGVPVPPPLSAVTPILAGARAADLLLAPPVRPPEEFVLPRVGLSIAFPSEPERFVGRLLPMSRASQALAPRSDLRGVFFYGMPGAGKTACALELAYRHAEGRFAGHVWYRAPEAGSDIAGELFNLFFEIERQLNAPGLGLTTALDDPERFRRFTLPRLRALLQGNSLLLVLDNLETLLTEGNRWRDGLWGEVVATLLAHDGPSRAVLTARRLPADLAGHPRLLAEPIHALSFAESVLLAWELINLGRLFGDDEGLGLLRQTLRVVQGHPKLLELADGQAADRTLLKARVDAAADELRDRAGTLDAFFAVGVKREGETRQDDADFVRALYGWTAGVAGGLSPTAGLLFTFLCRLEPEDRQQGIVQAVWPHFLTRLGPRAAAALAEPGQELPAVLATLQAAGLISIETPDTTNLPDTDLPIYYSIHPGVAETARAAAAPAVLDAADIELGNFYIALYQHGLETEMAGGGGIVVAGARRAAPYLLRQARWAEASTLLEQMLRRDSSPAALAFALPLLRHIAEATARTERALIDAGVLASALWQAGRTVEAEAIDRERIQKCIAQGNYRLASVAAGQVLNLLLSSGRLGEALAVAEEMAGTTRQAGLGPWTQLADEGQRLQVLNAMGRYDEVLAAVEALRPRLEALPPQSQAEEAVNPWSVRETLLDTGGTAAVYSERWETALALNAERVKAKQGRGAGALELARARFNDYGPLLRLRRYRDARALLLACRAVFEAERAARELGAVYSALADLEDATGGRAAAVRFQEIALGYSYQAGQPEDCAISHHNLANYLERQGAAAAAVLAHRLAAAAIRLEMQSGLLPTIIDNLAGSDLPPAPPTFAAVAAQVEEVEGVRFRALFEGLPRTAPDGDAAIAAVWGLLGEERTRRGGDAERGKAVLASLPPAIRAAIEQGDVAALRDALQGLPPQEAQAIVQQLQDAGLIRVG